MKNTPLTNPADYFRELAELLQKTQVTAEDGTALMLADGTKKAVDLILAVKSAGSKIMLIGNGGSAAIVSHIQNDLCDSVGVRAIVFNEAPFLTAVANDHGYETFFDKALRLWGEPEDLLIAVSSSGKSKSILDAVKTAREKGIRILTFSGFFSENPLRQLGDLNFYVASQKYGYVETAHAVLGHYLTDSAMASAKLEVKVP